MATEFPRGGFVRIGGAGIAMAAVFVIAAGGAAASDDFCSQAASALFDACEHSATADSLVTQAICLNVSDPAKRDACTAQGKSDGEEANQLCRDQKTTRLDTCQLIGEARYDPPFDPSL